MTAAFTFMDLQEQVSALLLGYASHEDAIGATAVEIPFYHRVAFSQSHCALCRYTFIRKDLIHQVVPDLGDPCIGVSLDIGERCCEYAGLVSTHYLRWSPCMKDHRDS